MYSKEKIKEFCGHAMSEYGESLVINEISKVNLVEKTDGSFIQIGIRPLIDDDFLILPSFDARLPGIGRMVAVGERDLLIRSILENKEIKNIKMKEDAEKFPKHVEFNNGNIIISTKFYVDIFTKLMHRIDYEEKYPRLDYRYRIISVPEKTLCNKIILMDKDAVLWEKQTFANETTGKKETLDININPSSSGKVDIIVRSINKIKYIDPERIKILEVED